MAKFGALPFLPALWVSTVSFHWVLYHFAEDVRLIDPRPLVGGYSFVALSGLMFIRPGSSPARLRAASSWRHS